MKKIAAVLPVLSAFLLTSQMVHAHNFKQQSELDNFATEFQLQYALTSNFQDTPSQFSATITLHNLSKLDLQQGNWQLYLHSVRKLDTMEQQGLKIEHVQGDLHRISPSKNFQGIKSGQQLVVPIKGSPWIVSYTDFMPRAFITAGTLKPAVLKNTDTEQIADFVAPFTKPEQQYRYDKPEKDQFVITTTQSRYQDNQASQGQALSTRDIQSRIIPTPKQLSVQRGDVTLQAPWVISFAGQLKNEAVLLQQELQAQGISLALSDQEYGDQRIVLSVDAKVGKAEAYRLTVTDSTIEIQGADAAGVFYGVQSLLSLTAMSATIPEVTIVDEPRYSWRGMHYDMGRNFHGVAVTKRLIEQMGRYKLNKLHLHLSEDEGWRLEIPGLPELTSIGGTRCFDLSEQHCLLTQLGTGPHKSGSGNGFYSRDEFIDLLKFAAARHIEVIPEFDMPGHARAAIKAMQARYNTYKKAGDLAKASQYLLSDPLDTSTYLTVQSYTDNSVNVCLDSSYAFIDKLVYELQQMYRSAGLRLTTYHMGGDEVGAGSWTGSPACQALFAKGQAGLAGVADLKPYFVSRVADILAKRELRLGGWEDGLMYDATTPFNRSQFNNPAVYANVWDNIWEWGVADRAYRLANAGYQVVLSHGTHLYFDHPYEANPHERGYYWASRFVDARKVFGYMPDNVYSNADKTRAGAPIDNLERLVGRALPPLTKPENILGMQGQVWSETIRTAEQLEEMVYPRLLPLAERAWHHAPWEADQASADVDQNARNADWLAFVQVMGQKELPRLANAGVQFYLPPPGAVIKNDSLDANVAYPGLWIEYSIDGGQRWSRWTESVQLPAGRVGGPAVLLRSKLPQQPKRSSRVTALN